MYFPVTRLLTVLDVLQVRSQIIAIRMQVANALSGNPPSPPGRDKSASTHAAALRSPVLDTLPPLSIRSKNHCLLAQVGEKQLCSVAIY